MTRAMFPFKKVRAQKVFSITIALIGLLLMFVTVPFLIKLGSTAIFGSSIGLILFFVGLIYFLSVVID